MRLLLGRAGTGKTRLCLREISDEVQKSPWGSALVLIVPDQATFAMERELARLGGGGVRVQVLSFKRLAFQVLRETGGAALLPVSELGRRMILKSILLKEKKQLALMGALQNRPGFLVSLSELVGELKTCRIAPSDLATVLNVQDRNKQDQLGLKLKDLQHIYQILQQELAGRFTDPDDYLDLLVKQLPIAKSLSGAKVWVDGFNSFTPQEYQVLTALLPKVSGLAVTLCLDQAATQGKLPDHHFLKQPRRAYNSLIKIARETGVLVQPVLLPEATPRFTNAPELAHLEKQFFVYPTKVYAQPVNNIQLMTGVNVRAEVEQIVRQIRQLLREKNLRPRQIMVAVRDVDTYFPLFRRMLADYEIPFFIDHRRPVLHHPLVELLRSALEVWQTNWHYDPLFRYLKTGLTPLQRTQVDELENYVLAAGIRGSAWYSDTDWHYLPGQLWEQDVADEVQKQQQNQYLAAINDLRRQAMAALRTAQLKIKKQATGRPASLPGVKWAQIMVELCLDLKLHQRMATKALKAQQQGLPELEQEHRQVWRLVNNLWDQLVEVLGNESLTVGEFADVVDAGLESVSLALIPPGLDGVTIGSLERSRPPQDTQVFFLPGLTESALPAKLRSYGVFTEGEREQLSRQLAQNKLNLPPVVQNRLEQEQFLTYRALTRTGGLLYISYPLGDEEGRAVTPSSVVRRVQALFPALVAKQIPADPPGDDTDALFIEHPAGLLPRLASRWQEAAWNQPVHPLWWRVYNLLLERHPWRTGLGFLVEGFVSRNYEPPLDVDLGRRIWTRQLRGQSVLNTSVSRLESFVQCPFAHFLAHGLGLKERAMYRLAAPETGQLYHEALRKFVEQVTLDAGWESLQQEQIPTICNQIIDDLALRLQGRILLSSARLRRQKESLLERVVDSARAITKQIKGSGFRPAALEVYFGTQGLAKPPTSPVTNINVGSSSVPYLKDLLLPPFEIKVDQDLVLSIGGRIDRVDLAPTATGFYLRVVDYKTSSAKLELPRVLSGAQLQLLVYLWAALKKLVGQRGINALQPAGALYFQVQKPLLKVEAPELAPGQLEPDWLKQFRLNGWLVDGGMGLHQLQDTAMEEGASSLLVPLALTKAGQIHGSYQNYVYNLNEWRLLLQNIGRLLKIIGRDVVKGQVDIAPLKIGNQTACDFCIYGAVCRFDLALPENKYRNLNLDAGALRKQLNQAAAQKEEKYFDFYRLD